MGNDGERDIAPIYPQRLDYFHRLERQVVRRNLDCLPEDFMFRLTWEEAAALRSQSVILNPSADSGLGSQSLTLKCGTHLKYRPSAFTEQCVAMLAESVRAAAQA